MKKSVLLVLAFLLSFSYAFSQNYPVDKGATIISGMASFSSLGYEDADNRITTIALLPMLNYFVAPNVFLGGVAELNRTSYGNDSQSSFAIGPSLGYAIGNEKSTAFPYIGVGFRYGKSSKSEVLISKGYSNIWFATTRRYEASRTDIVIGGGIIVPAKKHIGIIIDAGYHIMSTKPEYAYESYSSNLFSIDIGFAGLLF